MDKQRGSKGFEAVGTGAVLGSVTYLLGIVCGLGVCAMLGLFGLICVAYVAASLWLESRDTGCDAA